MEQINLDIDKRNALLRANPPMLLDVETAVIVLGLTEKAVREMFKNKSFPKVRRGNRFYALTSKVDEWLENHIDKEIAWI